MKQPSLLLLVKFKSQLSLDEVREVMHRRSDEFRALAGLIQKYYLQDTASGEYAGLYLWESEHAFSEYRDSDLRASIADAYRTVGEPRVEVFRVLEPLRQ